MHRLILCFLLFLTACGEENSPAKPDKLLLQSAAFSDLPGWSEENFDGFGTAFSRSCGRIAKIDPDEPFGVLEQAGKYAHWQDICKKFNETSRENIRHFFETHFVPHAVYNNDTPYGLFTGYYEASLKGAREKKEGYTTPLYQRPDDLIMVNLGEFRENLKSVRIAGRVINGTLKPYETRTQIVGGDWPHHEKVLVWVDSPIDAFFVQIQGSGIVTLEDGSIMRIGYAGQNGHPYHAIGRTLIEMGEIKKEDVSLQSIRAWLEQHPGKADRVMNTNASYVFFHELTGEGPLGAEGLPLTEKRSLAIDRTKISYGLPLWLDIEHPQNNAGRIRRLMIAQDTGGAITGSVRGDFFWGYGKQAEQMAGNMKSQGRYWVLLPKDSKGDTE